MKISILLKYKILEWIYVINYEQIAADNWSVVCIYIQPSLFW